MSVLYEPTGAAREYAALAFNPYKGCDHGCTYCYAPLVTRKNRQVFHNETAPRKDILMRLDKDITRMMKKGIKKDPVLLSFTCDPYQDMEQTHRLTQRSINILNANGFPVEILTKAGKLAQRDFDLLAKYDFNKFGTSLTFTDDAKSLEWEPNAALPQERIDNLIAAKEKGISTWVSIEPIVVPEQSLELIDLTHEFVDFYGVGKLNYNKKISGIFNWKNVREKIIKKLKRYKKKYKLHQSLKEA